MSSTSQPTEAKRKRIDRLFLSFSAFYGQLWRSQLKSDEFLMFMKNEWLEALHDFEERHMNEAIKRCRKEKEYPPTLPLFIDLCKAAKTREIPLFQRNEYKKGNPEIAQQHLSKIKALLSSKN